jgi:hypothetical protein
MVKIWETLQNVQFKSNTYGTVSYIYGNILQLGVSPELEKASQDIVAVLTGLC